MLLSTVAKLLIGNATWSHKNLRLFNWSVITPVSEARFFGEIITSYLLPRANPLYAGLNTSAFN